MSNIAETLTARYGLQGKVAVVSGASGLIGYEIAKDLCQLGAQVIALYHSNQTAIEKLKKDTSSFTGNITSYQVDIQIPDEVNALMTHIRKTHKTLDILVLAAATKSKSSFLLSNHSNETSIFSLNIHGLFNMARVGLRRMLANRWGRVILIGSRAGLHGMPGQASYAASKAALTAFASSVAEEVAGRDITINVLAPGAVMSPDEDLYSPEEQASVIERIAARRLGTAQEIAAATTFLCSEAASYINATVIPMDGGARF